MSWLSLHQYIRSIQAAVPILLAAHLPKVVCFCWRICLEVVGWVCVVDVVLFATIVNACSSSCYAIWENTMWCLVVLLSTLICLCCISAGSEVENVHVDLLIGWDVDCCMVLLLLLLLGFNSWKLQLVFTWLLCLDMVVLFVWWCYCLCVLQWCCCCHLCNWYIRCKVMFVVGRWCWKCRCWRVLLIWLSSYACVDVFFACAFVSWICSLFFLLTFIVYFSFIVGSIRWYDCDYRSISPAHLH